MTEPPCTVNSSRRRFTVENLVSFYRSGTSYEVVSDGICITGLRNVSLESYIDAQPLFCSLQHKQPCINCASLLMVARMILKDGFVPLHTAFKKAFPDITYRSESAKQRLLRIPLVALRVGMPNSGQSIVYLCEYTPNVNYRHFVTLLSASQSAQKCPLTKEKLKDIMSVAQSDRERECIRYTAFVTSGLSATAARKQFGFDNMTTRSQRFEDAINEIRATREAIDSLCKIQEKVALAEYGIYISSDSEDMTDGEETSLTDIDSSENERCNPKVVAVEDAIKMATAAKFNWFEIAQETEHRNEAICFESLCSALPQKEQELLIESHSAYLCIEKSDLPEQQHTVDAFNGLIVSESEEDNPDINLSTQLSEETKLMLKKRIASIRRRNRRLHAKTVSQKRYLQKKQSKRVKTIITTYPNIGKEIESFVESRSVGADAWRRTGVFTFDGNKPIKDKVTFSKIKDHLEEKYKRKFAYGTIVELCVARNRRRKSAKRYKGVANVTCRRARKGFQLRYNPDNHWSAAFYQILNYLQYKDGKNILNLNWDDAAGFRLDSLTTHRLHRSPVVKGKEILSTFTDFVNSYPSILQTTCYNFSATETTGEVCAGVVKGAGVYPKNPIQHACDLEMLQEMSELQPAFLNPSTSQPKLIECVRVDGASDEGPSHLEVQYLWTLRHIERPTFVTLVTARNSGASHLNRVELQNGCLALAHANLFIPSNLHGTCFDPKTGRLDSERLKKNMDAATEIYISRANGAPCNGTKIHLYRGADSSKLQEIRTHLSVFLKGSKKDKLCVKEDNPEVWAHFERVWSVRERHMLKGVPQQYAFYLKCCMQSTCCHPLCKQTRAGSLEMTSWFPGGPSLDTLPLPTPDPKRPWGGACIKCEGKCNGHFLEPALAVKNSVFPQMMKPPSTICVRLWENQTYGAEIQN